MIKKTIAAIVLLAYGAAHATDRNDDAVDKFMATSGLKISLDKLPQQMAGQLFGHMPYAQEATKRKIEQAYANAFPTGVITGAVRSSLLSERSSRLVRLQELVSSPNSMTMTALELKEPTEKEMRDFSATLQSKPPSKQRISLLKEILDESHAAEGVVKITIEASRSIALASSNGCPDEVKRIRNELEKKRGEIADAVYGAMVLSMLYTYRTASDSELLEYLSTYRDPVARSFHINSTRVIATEYLSRWKKVEMVLDEVGDELSNRSVFARSCRKPSITNIAPERVTAAEKTLPMPIKSASLSRQDARKCLELTDNAKIAACAEKYR